MGSRYRRFPSMQALIGFEAAARLESFSRAADELSMTQSAVSHQIRGLEDQLGQALFRRQGRSVEMTDAGRDMLETTRRTLETLETGLSRLDFYAKPGSVVIACPPAFARHWLLPRLPQLRADLPDIDPWIVSLDGIGDFDHNENDMFIALGEEDWRGLASIELAPERLAPFCSPDYRRKLGRKRPTASAMAALDLLHDESWEGWSRWFEMSDFDEPAPVRGFNFSDPGLAMDAAIADQGVVLGSQLLAQSAVESGQLIQMMPDSIERQESWYLVGDPERIAGDAEKCLWEWLVVNSAGERSV